MSTGANGAGQGGHHAAVQSGLTRVRGVECAQGIIWALWDGLRGHARAALATPILHIYTLTCISTMTVTRMDTTSVCRGGALCPPR
jgi:hypothetical protein